MTRAGWAYGDIAGQDNPLWLTILGSAYTSPVLHETRDGAQGALDESPAKTSPWLSMAVAHVTEVPHGGVSGGYAYRITPGTVRPS